jgi:non-specific serine/threonine protein kinase
LKILVSDVKKPIPELQALHFLNQLGFSDKTQHVIQLLDEFVHHGPNGLHTCLVFEPMGPSVNSMVERLPQSTPRKRGMKIRYPFWMARRILKQALQALEYLHIHGMAHGDFQPGNMLLCIDNIDSMPEEVLQQDIDSVSGSTSPTVQRLDGKQDKWAPSYLCTAQPLVQFTRHDEGLNIKLSDLGGGESSARNVSLSCGAWYSNANLAILAFFLANPPTKIPTPKGLRAPELILSGAINSSLDVWAFGCLVFELVTGQPLFCVPGSEFEDDDHLLLLSARIGPLPEELFQLWNTSPLYFTADRQLYNCQLGGVPENGEPLMVEQLSMEELFDQADTGLGEKDARLVKGLVRQILQYDSSARPSPADLLNSSLFC